MCPILGPSHLARLVVAAALAATVWCAAPATAQEAQCADRHVRLADGCASFGAAAEGVRQIIREEIAENGLNAVIVRISVGGAPLVAEAWGQSMTGVPATPDMHFRNGAIAIAYLTTVLLQLQEQGVLSVEDKLAEYLPSLPNADDITLEMLANNTSGYGDYVDLAVLPIYDNVFRQWTPDELVEIGLSKPAACAPGTCFAYAHTNYVILGKVLEKASGREVADLIREGILNPLGLAGTQSIDTPAIPEPVLHAFDDERGLYEESTYWNPSWTLARGAIMTTDIDDVERSAIAIGKGLLLSQASLERMLAPTTAEFAPMTADTYYGLGVIVNNGWIMQTPSFHGYSAVMAYLPSSEIAVAVTTTNGPDTTADRATNDLFYRLAAYLSPERAPQAPRR